MPAGSPASLTLLESAFPFPAVSAIAKQDRYCRDHIYSIHKWWARRPPAVIRALLLAAVLPADTPERDFWKLFADSDDKLEGLQVGDPFMGGATTLVEAARLGARVSGIDVDPLAVRIARAELQDLDHEAFERHANELLEHLQKVAAPLFPGKGTGEPVHYFWLREVECDGCGEASLLYRNLWLVRERALDGAVVRDQPGVAFCPGCRKLHELSAERKQLHCCGKYWPIDRGTYRRARFACPHCETVSRNDELEVGKLKRVLIAVEETFPKRRRRLRKPRRADQRALAKAERRARKRQIAAAEAALDGVDSGRPVSYGFEKVVDLFSARQQIVFDEAFSWTRTLEADEPVKGALLLALSNALGHNNLLCGYATDYGRLSALFSGVRAYSMPVLGVELNPLHETAGRGTVAMTLGRVSRGQQEEVARHTFDPTKGEVVPQKFKSKINGTSSVACRSADKGLPRPFGSFDLVLTDPPYFDFIPYSDLSLLYRAWLAEDLEAEALPGAPIYPVGDDPVNEFGSRLGRAFGHAREALKDGGLVTFTFHSSHEEAWTAVEKALKRANLRVSGVFPVWADGRSGGHGHAGNCEWDLVFVCRPSAKNLSRITVEVDEWLRELSDEDLEESDKRSMKLGLAMAKRLNV